MKALCPSISYYLVHLEQLRLKPSTSATQINKTSPVTNRDTYTTSNPLGTLYCIKVFPFNSIHCKSTLSKLVKIIVTDKQHSTSLSKCSIAPNNQKSDVEDTNLHDTIDHSQETAAQIGYAKQDPGPDIECRSDCEIFLFCEHK